MKKQCKFYFLLNNILYRKVRQNCVSAIAFLPPHLFQEVFSDTDEIIKEWVSGFTPRDLYIEQLVEMLPREDAERVRMYPALKDDLEKVKYESKFDIG